MEPGSTQWLPDSDLAGALGHRDQHDVHDANATHQQAHGRNTCQKAGEHLGGLLLSGQNVLLIPNGEIVFSARTDFMFPPQHPLEIDHSLFDRYAVFYLNRKRAHPVAAEDPVSRSLQGDQYLLVRVAEAAGGTLLAQHTDDFEWYSPNEQRLV